MAFRNKQSTQPVLTWTQVLPGTCLFQPLNSLRRLLSAGSVLPEPGHQPWVPRVVKREAVLRAASSSVGFLTAFLCLPRCLDSSAQ